ncbi:hypothetical protein [Flammeovirga sp. SJP92]|uniref:hypothetical protein n=1 Tax=Flammeovirga sp. SJP92 TaxID=1775430 RepID=UPI00078967C7|nr:hypothetical protein [Flammeovirga sp. SJP92]KXX71832.1 hypothetical protein AVL50_03340 [Flammeovirga sp. SJP92]
MNLLRNHIDFQDILFQPFNNEVFIQWFYSNEALLQSDYITFYNALLEESDAFLFNSTKVKELVKQYFIDEEVYEWWELKFYLNQILQPQFSTEFGSYLYYDYYEDNGIQFLFYLSDLLVLYCFDKIELGLPQLKSPARSEFNSNVLYPRILNEVNKVLTISTASTIAENDSNWVEKYGLYPSDSFQKILNWYKNEINLLASN